MIKRKAPKLILYQKYLKELSEEREREAAADKVGIEAEKIVIEKKSLGATVLSVFVNILLMALKAIACIVVIGLFSLAVTVLLNDELRNAVFEIMRDNIC